MEGRIKENFRKEEEDAMTFKHTFTLFFFIIGLFLFVSILHYANTAKLNGESEDCYDRHHNKIEGLECTVEGSFDTRINAQITLSILGVIALILFTFLGGIMDDQLNSMERYGYL